MEMSPNASESLAEAEPVAATPRPQPKPIRKAGGEASKALRFLNDDGLSLYLKEISNTKTLSLDEEADLAQRIRQGDRRALNKLVRANLKFVVSVCRNYQNQGLPMTDLINEGNLGLIRAAKRFDETKQFKFISYAVWWIRQAILQALAEQSRIINVPVNRVGLIHKINRTGSQLEQKLGRAPSQAEVSDAMRLSETDLKETLELSSSPLSLDARLHQTEEENCLADVLKDENAESPDARPIEGSLKKTVGEVLSTLEEREEEIIRLYFGIGVDTPYTLEEIGQRFNLTRERVRQIKEKAVKRLKHPTRVRQLSVFRT